MLPNWSHSIHHDGSSRYVQRAGLAVGDSARLWLRVAADAPVEGVYLRTCPDGEEAIVAMEPVGVEGVCRWWQVSLRLTMRRTGYRFLLRTREGNRWYNAAGVWMHNPTDANDFVLLAGYEEPAWVRDSVFYQIFPDRFADGDPTNNVRDGEHLCYGRPVAARPWGAPPRKSHGSCEFYGGDLQGIIERLDYLQDLGVTALYLNPIFVAPSSHKYDVADYSQVDPHFGGNAALARLREALSAREMRLVLDIAPNHCGSTHPWFQAALADPQAPEAEFFTFHRHPDDYECWLGVRSLPKLNYRSERLRDLMYAGPDALMRQWMRPPYRIDGWRIDVANMLGRQGPWNLGHKLGRGIRRAVKSENPAAYLLGEHFFDGTPHLQGDELDATMNYQGFTFPVWSWLGGSGAQKPWSDPHPLPTAAMAAQLAAFRAAAPWQIAVQQFNLLGSHDTARVRSVLEHDQRRLRVAVVLLFTYPGVPCIYYGDEVGLSGNGDPESRRTMPWNEGEWDHDLRAFYQRLARLRRASPALRQGGFQLLYATGHTLAYLRETPDERLIVVARRGDDGLAALPVRHGGLPDGVRLREILSGVETTVQDGWLPLTGLPAAGAQIWQET